ncbi:Similar to sqd: RNA-binding protein squid (Drosophila melanogaster) [Cotesia congregata]|uniref:Similar to sqd: RNA-binding protein squid (Drosophila melanogaster) n=1 Tax=Cotesia congregata TaxID=51543 RepID=A0A8J2MIX4_COTCN|nr:Similar to sqd: RNA-binding protein squid (Drosophila melanogaster) [Cotesia congregata]
MAAVDCYQNQVENSNSSGNHTDNDYNTQDNQNQQQRSGTMQRSGSNNGGQSMDPKNQQQATAGIPGMDDERKLFIGGLSRHTTDKELREHFGKFGEIESITVKMDQHTGISRGFAFMHGKVFVGGLTPDMTDDDIKAYFSQFGTVVELQAPFDKTKNQRKGFCFITFDSKDVVYKLLKAPKQTINGKEVDVKKVKVNPEVNRQGFWNFGYGYGYGGGYNYMPEYTNGYHGGYDENYSNYDSYPGYESFDNHASYTAAVNKPRGNAQGPRQFQRHQPY